MNHPHHSNWQADPWLQWIPTVHRALGCDSSRFECPAKDVDRSLEAACAHWEALHYTMKALLAWDSPAMGLASWYAAGKPAQGSDVLQLVQAGWGSGQHMNLYAAWCWAGQYGFMTADEIQPHLLAQTAPYGDENCWSELKCLPNPTAHNPLYGGTNPLHLGHSDELGFDAGDPAQCYLVTDHTTRRAVLVVSGLGSWRTELTQHGASLSPMQNRSWHVEVFDRQIGFLGKFRRSRVTGKWFAGSHAIHLWGCSAAPG